MDEHRLLAMAAGAVPGVTRAEAADSRMSGGLPPSVIVMLWRWPHGAWWDETVAALSRAGVCAEWRPGRNADDIPVWLVRLWRR